MRIAAILSLLIFALLAAGSSTGATIRSETLLPLATSGA